MSHPVIVRTNPLSISIGSNYTLPLSQPPTLVAATSLRTMVITDNRVVTYHTIDGELEYEFSLPGVASGVYLDLNHAYFLVECKVYYLNLVGPDLTGLVQLEDLDSRITHLSRTGDRAVVLDNQGVVYSLRRDSSRELFNLNDEVEHEEIVGLAIMNTHDSAYVVLWTRDMVIGLSGAGTVKLPFVGGVSDVYVQGEHALVAGVDDLCIHVIDSDMEVQNSDGLCNGNSYLAIVPEVSHVYELPRLMIIYESGYGTVFDSPHLPIIMADVESVTGDVFTNQPCNTRLKKAVS